MTHVILLDYVLLTVMHCRIHYGRGRFGEAIGHHFRKPFLHVTNYAAKFTFQKVVH